MLHTPLIAALALALAASSAQAQTYRDTSGTIVQGVFPLPYPFTSLCPGQHNLAPVAATALTAPTGIASGGACITQGVTARYATICASGAMVKYTTDGSTTPTSSIGQPLSAGSCVDLSGATVISNFKAISPSGTLDVEFFQ